MSKCPGESTMILHVSDMLSPDCGKGWVNPEVHLNALKRLDFCEQEYKYKEAECKEAQAEAAAAVLFVEELVSLGGNNIPWHIVEGQARKITNSTAAKALLERLAKLDTVAKTGRLFEKSVCTVCEYGQEAQDFRDAINAVK